MFQFPGFPRYNYEFIIPYRNITCGEFPHSDIRGFVRSFAAHRGFSQLVTSFFGAMYQGILPTLFVAYSFPCTSRYTSRHKSALRFKNSKTLFLFFDLIVSYFRINLKSFRYFKVFCLLYFILKLNSLLIS